jgi:DNA mismatch repair protein MutS2
MNQHSIRILEFDKVLENCRGFSIFEGEQRGIESFPLFTDGDALEAELRLVRAFRLMIRSRHHGAQGLEFIGDALSMLGKQGTVLELEQLSRISALLHQYAELLGWMRGMTEEDILDENQSAAVLEYLADWDQPRDVLKIISPYFDANGRFREDEIPELRDVIRSIQKLHGQIQESARRYLSDHKDIWSSDEATQRDGRVVLALKSDHRGKVGGIVHGSSNSGQTIYIEPQELLEKNNALNEERSRYHQEVHKILRRCSDALREYTGLLTGMEQRLLRFNSLQARGRYAASVDGNPAGISRQGVRLIAARHPFLGTRAVPISIEIQGDTRILVVSGPNTGGKTVSMKTLGLLSLMHQSGMEIPAGDASELPLFSDILVDIGDEQSIDAGLSTFSAHLKNLSTVLDGARDDALVLLDELGSGTNPTEGSALSMAVMEHLSDSQVYAMVTTHHDILKAYAYNHPRMENASVQFDAKSLEPTYTIASGIPGESHALDIAQRVGMDSHIVARAREHISREGLSMQQLIEDLRTRQQEMIQAQLELSERRKQADRRDADLGEREKLIKEGELALKEQKLLEHDAYLAQSRKEIERIIYQLTQERRRLRRKNRERSETGAEAEAEAPDLNRDTRAALDGLSRRQREELGRVRDDQQRAYEQRLASSSSASAYGPGDRVRYKGSGKPAEIIEAGKKKHSWVILAGSMRMTVAEKDLELVQRAAGQAGLSESEKVHVEYDKGGGSAAAGGPQIRSGLTLDVRGMRLDEALKEVEQFLDRAAVEGLQFFSVIHGKGTGVLQQGIHQYLGDSPVVKQITFAPPEDGGYGKSYVYLN